MCVTANTTITMTKSHSTRNFSFSVIIRSLPLPAYDKRLGRSCDLPRRPDWLGVVRQRRRRRFGRVVADQAHLGEQVRHLHAGERLEQRRYLRRDLRDVTGELVRPGRVSVAGLYDARLVDFAEGLSERWHDFRQAGDQFVDHGGLVVFLVGFRLDVHRLGFRLALFEDDFGFGFALRANRRRAAFRFADQALPFRFCERLDALPLDFRLFQHGRNQFAFAARDLRFLHLNLRFALHLLHTHRFGDYLLLLDVGFDLVSLVRLRLRLFRGFQKAGLLDVQIAFGFRLLGLRSRFRGHSLLVRLRFCPGGRALRLGTLDRDVAVRFGCRHFRIALDARNVRPAHVGDVFVFVAHFLQREAHHFEPHLVHVIRARGTHAVGNHFRLLHDLLHGKLPDNPAQMTFHHKPDQPFALLRPLGQELLRRGSNGLRIGFHFDLRDRFDRHGQALIGVQALLRSDVKRHQLQREFTALLDHRIDNRAAAFDDARPPKAVNYQRLVRTRFAKQLGQNRHDKEHCENTHAGYYRNEWQPKHKASVFLPAWTGCVVLQSEILHSASA